MNIRAYMKLFILSFFVCFICIGLLLTPTVESQFSGFNFTLPDTDLGYGGLFNPYVFWPGLGLKSMALSIPLVPLLPFSYGNFGLRNLPRALSQWGYNSFNPSMGLSGFGLNNPFGTFSLFGYNFLNPFSFVITLEGFLGAGYNIVLSCILTSPTTIIGFYTVLGTAIPIMDEGVFDLILSPTVI